jgi:probable rRNA maturation factor
MIEVEVLDEPAGLPEGEVRRLCVLSATRMRVEQGHVAIEFVDAERIARLNGEHRNKPVPTDVLSFPIDGIGARSPTDVPIELGDVVICPAHTVDLREAVVHGMLHLLGMDHERDDGEMLELQRQLLAGADG